jgi:hypothetical protein
MTPAELKRPILTALQTVLRPLGFRKMSSLFQLDRGKVVHLIEVQGSNDNKANEAEFTVNVGVFAPELVYPDVRDITKPSIALAHWRTRLGSLSPENKDLWWHVASFGEAATAAADIADRTHKFALPALDQLADLSALAVLWKSGQSPGLTEFQRVELLSRLQEHLLLPASNA